MSIVIGNGYCDLKFNSGDVYCISNGSNTFRKSINTIMLTPVIGKRKDRQGY